MKKRLGILIFTVAALTTATVAAPMPKVIILGFDGVDPGLCARWMEEGKLPNLAKLRSEGTFLPLHTVNPAQSPVAWSCFSCGMNPGKTGIFDFLRRMNDGDRPRPVIAYGHAEEKPVLGGRFLRLFIPAAPGGLVFLVVFLAMRRFGKRPALVSSLTVGAVALGVCLFVIVCWLPAYAPYPVNDRKGGEFWDLIGRNGVRSRILLGPITFPARPFPNGKLLCGLGTPDIKGTNGLWTVYSSNAVRRRATETGGVVLPITIKGERVETFVAGPRNIITGEEETKVPLDIEIDRGSKKITLSCQNQTQTIVEGEWSDWFEFEFRVSPLIRIRGMGRFHLNRVDPGLDLFLSPIQFHPKGSLPGFNISFPRSYAAEIASEIGLFDTLGWAASTNPLKDEMIDDKAFMEGLWLIFNKRRDLLYNELSKKDWDVLTIVFGETDRVQHMMFRFIDPQHPLYNGQSKKEFGDSILNVYEEMDRIVGEVMARYVDENTTLMVLSDHGFASFRRSVNINTWLVREGYLAPEGESRDLKIADLFQGDILFEKIDWSRTRAYSMGLGDIFINLEGREPQGIVKPGEEYDRLRREIAERFETLHDPKDNAKVVERVYHADEIYTGPYVKESADLIIGFAKGYRVSWQTCLGGIPPEIIEDNLMKWSGDHCSIDPSLIPGVFFCNRKPRREELSLIDIAPTVMKIFDTEVPPDVDGKAIEWE